MNSRIISAIIASLIYAVAGSQLCPDCILLINQLNDYYRFDHNIFLAESSTILDNWFERATTSHRGASDNFTSQTIFTFDNNSDYNNPKKIERISSKHTLVVVVIKTLSFEATLLAKIKSIRETDHNVKVGVFLGPTRTAVNTTDLVAQFFRWAWNVGIVNIFSALRMSAGGNGTSLQVYKYNPFRESDWIYRIPIGSPQNYFSNKRPNYYANKLTFLVLSDYDLSPTENNFWNTIISAFNATGFFGNRMTSIEYRKVKQLDTDFVLSGQFMLRTYEIYPYRQTGLVFIVPHSQPYSDFLVYLQNRSWIIIIVYAIAVIVTASLLLAVSGYLHKKKILLFESAINVLNLILNENVGIKYQTLPLAEVYITLPLTFTGLIVMNGIVSIFQSYITAPIYQPQINSIEDLYKSSIPIIIGEVGWKQYFVKLMEDMTQYGGWSERLHETNKAELCNVIATFNNSVAFFFNDFETREFFELQNRLELKKYHLLRKMGLPRFLRTFRNRPGFAFIENINDMVHQMNAAGLIEKWINDITRIGMKQLWQKNFIPERSNQSHPSEFTVPTVIWCGWVASVVVFICEMIWSKVNVALRGR